MRGFSLAAALALLIAACGDTSTSTTDGSAAPTTTTPSAAATTTSIEDGGHTHDGEEAALEWDADFPAPAINVEVTGDAASGWVISIGELPQFEFSSLKVFDHVPGQGHTHVYIDGGLFTMAYETDVVVPELTPGEHEVKVVLSRNDHLDYALDGEEIAGTAVFTVEGDVEAADVTATASFESGEVTTETSRVKAEVGDVVELVVTSDVTEEVHVHGYDVFGDLEPGEPETLRFVADIPGIFEIEMESSGTLIFALEVS